MQRTRPLANTNPEFSVLECPGYREYRVENWHLARDGSGRVVRGTLGWTWREAVIPILVSIVWLKVKSRPAVCIALALLLVYLIWVKCNQVLFESVIVLPPHGLQLETHRGFPSYPLTASRRFIPMQFLQNFLINEGLRRWNVRYYLAAIKHTGTSGFTLEVAYENLLPHFPVLLEVYGGVQEILFRRVDNPPSPI